MVKRLCCLVCIYLISCYKPLNLFFIFYNHLIGQMKHGNNSACPLRRNRPDLWNSGCIKPKCREGGSSAADVDVPAFEERASEREARMRERVVARSQNE